MLYATCSCDWDPRLKWPALPKSQPIAWVTGQWHSQGGVFRIRNGKCQFNCLEKMDASSSLTLLANFPTFFFLASELQGKSPVWYHISVAVLQGQLRAVAKVPGKQKEMQSSSLDSGNCTWPFLIGTCLADCFPLYWVSCLCSLLRGFSVSTDNRVHIFKPVSVQAMW